jgi:hypothetical protein
MNYKEALKAAIEGKKVRVCDWLEGEFVRFNSGWFIDEDGHHYRISSFADNEKWELYVDSLPELYVDSLPELRQAAERELHQLRLHTACADIAAYMEATKNV